MADYYPLLARALDALPDRSPALRKAVYDRARSALIGQLRSLEPPLPEADIEAERQALDNAIARLEADYGAPAPTPAAPQPPAPPPVPEPAAAPEEPSPPQAQAPASAQPGPRPPAAAPPRAVPPSPAAPAPAPEPPSPQALPEPGPPATFVPFVPPRRPKADEALPPVPAEAAEGQPAELGPVPIEAPAGRRPRLDVKPQRADRSRRMRNLVLGGVLAMVIGLIAAAAILLADKRGDLAQTAADPAAAGRPAADAKLSDRVGGERAEPGAGGSDVMVAQRAVLYEENLADPKAPPVAIQGRAVWRLESVSGEQGQPLQNEVRASVDFADAGLSLVMTIRKNLDASLSASHTITLAFRTSGAGAEKRTVQEIGLLQLKDQEAMRGSPVSGLLSKIQDNLFLVVLSNLQPGDVERNTDLLTHRNWFELVIKYRNGQRAILTFEKGNAGGRVVQSAFDQWRG